MTCPDGGMLQSWLDRELPAADLRSATGHLATCPSCSSRLEELRSRDAEVRAMLDTLSAASAHPAVVYLHGPARWRWPAAAAAGVLAASLLLVAILGQRPVPNHPAGQQSGYFLPLSDEPMQAGMLVHVSVPAALVNFAGAVPPSGLVRAEVIVGEDRQPRAVRFLAQ